MNKQFDTEGGLTQIAMAFLEEWPFVVVPVVAVGILTKLGLRISDKIDKKKHMQTARKLIEATKKSVANHGSFSQDSNINPCFSLLVSVWKSMKRI
jgi:predicted alpha-1,6-mannanase (GH76 family)